MSACNSRVGFHLLSVAVGATIAVSSSLSFATTAAPAGQVPGVLSTARSLHAFAACFADREERARRSWSFVPNESGGVFTDRGSNAGTQFTYELHFREGAPTSKISIELTGPVEDQLRIRSEVETCR